MNCDEVRDLIAAYSLGTATPEERLAVEGHMSTCDLHDDVATALAVSMAIAVAAPEIAPPAALKSRLLQAATATAPAKPAAALRRPALRFMFGGYSVAAVLAVVVIALTGWNLTLQTGRDETFVHYYRGDDDNWLRIETVLGKPGADVSLGGLEPLEAGQRYQIWATRGDDVVPVGNFNTNAESRWAGEFNFTFFAADRVWITVEPGGGSPQPTGEAVLRTLF